MIASAAASVVRRSLSVTSRRAMASLPATMKVRLKTLHSIDTSSSSRLDFVLLLKR
jgi:hypothetical protein